MEIISKIHQVRGTILSVNRFVNEREYMTVTTKDGKTAVQVLFEEVAPKYKDRNGGYTRVSKTGFRRSDATPMATIELV